MLRARLGLLLGLLLLLEGRLEDSARVLAGGLVCDGLLCQSLSVFVSMCTFVLTFMRVSEYFSTSKQVLLY